MRVLTSFLCTVAFTLSSGVFAEQTIYDCGTLSDEFTSYKLRVDDDLVVLETTHGAKGIESKTHALMRERPSKTDAKLFEGQGITASFKSVQVDFLTVLSVKIWDKQGHSAHCLAS